MVSQTQFLRVSKWISLILGTTTPASRQFSMYLQVLHAVFFYFYVLLCLNVKQLSKSHALTTQCFEFAVQEI